MQKTVISTKYYIVLIVTTFWIYVTELIWSHFMACTGDQEAGSKHKQSLQTWAKKSQAREHTIIIISVFQIDWNWQWTLKPSEPRTSMTPTSFEPCTSSAPNQFSSGHIWIPLFIPRPNQWMLCQRTTEIWQVPINSLVKMPLISLTSINFLSQKDWSFPWTRFKY